MFRIKRNASRNFVRKKRTWKKDEIAMFAMKVVDAKDAKLKASLEDAGNSMNGGLANSKEGKSCTKCDKILFKILWAVIPCG